VLYIHETLPQTLCLCVCESSRDDMEALRCTLVPPFLVYNRRHKNPLFCDAGAYFVYRCRFSRSLLLLLSTTSCIGNSIALCAI